MSSEAKMKKQMAQMEEFYKKKLKEARDKQSEAEEELQSVKDRLAEEVSLSLKTGDTEDMTSPVNKTRLKETYIHLVINKWPQIKDQLKSDQEDPKTVLQCIKDIFNKAAEDMDTMKTTMDKVLRGNRSDTDLPPKVQEYRLSSIENLQMALFNCNKQALHCKAVGKALGSCQELVSELYWLGCLLALNNPPLQPDWGNHRPGMDRWDILPTNVTENINSISDFTDKGPPQQQKGSSELGCVTSETNSKSVASEIHTKAEDSSLAQRSCGSKGTMSSSSPSISDFTDKGPPQQQKGSSELGCVTSETNYKSVASEIHTKAEDSSLAQRSCGSKGTMSSSSPRGTSDTPGQPNSIESQEQSSWYDGCVIS